MKATLQTGGQTKRQPASLRRRLTLWLPALAVCLFLAMLVASAIGPVKVPLDHTLGILTNKLLPQGTISLSIPFTEREWLVVSEVRLPRVIAGALVGAALSTAGVLMQGLFRNPMAEPGIIGVSSGGAVGAVASIYFGWAAFNPWALPVSAFVGSLVAMGIVMAIWAATRRSSVTTLLLVGIAMNSLLGAVISVMVATAKNDQELRGIVFWMQGGLEARTWEHVSLIILPILISCLLAVFFGRDLNMMLLGDDQAQSSGVNVSRVRYLLLGLASLMTGTAVAISGVIGFVGLSVPHMVRLLIGPDHRLLLPASAIAGATFLVLADLIARSAFQPITLQVGVVTAAIGAPLFLFLALRSHRGGHANG